MSGRKYWSIFGPYFAVDVAGLRLPGNTGAEALDGPRQRPAAAAGDDKLAATETEVIVKGVGLADIEGSGLRAVGPPDEDLLFDGGRLVRDHGNRHARLQRHLRGDGSGDLSAFLRLRSGGIDDDILGEVDLRTGREQQCHGG